MYGQDMMGKRTGTQLTCRGQVMKLKDAVKDFVAKLNSGPMDRNHVWKSLQEWIGVALSYPLTATQLTYDEWEKEIMIPLLQAVLPRAGFSRSMPRAIVFGPSEHQGLNFMHLWYKQELTHLQTCLLLLNTDSVISGLLQQSFEALRLEVGYPGEITDAPREPFSATTTNSWVNNVWDFADRFGFQFRDEFPKLQPAREADQFLMKAFVDHGYDGLQLHKLNTCHQFLKVITLADITTGDGKRLTDEALAGEPSGTTWHHYNWPRNPPKLSRSHWKLWEKALHQAFTSGNTSSTSLQDPLGSWLVDPSDSWQWFYDPISNALYHKTDDDWQAYTPTSSRSTHSSRPTNKAFKLNPSIFIPPNFCVSWYLGVYYEWSQTPDGRLLVHLSQEAHVHKLLEKEQLMDCLPASTPYRSGLPINQIPHDGVPPECKPELLKCYQSILGGLVWLSTNTRPNITACVSLLASHLKNPSDGHLEAAQYLLQYLKGSSDWGIRYMSPDLHNNVASGSQL
jgi:hypothetical protein